MGVKPQKSKDRSGNGNRKQNNNDISSLIRQISDTDKNKQRYTACQSIKTVGKVDGIGHPNNDDKGKGNGDPFGEEDPDYDCWGTWTFTYDRIPVVQPCEPSVS